LTEWGRSDCYWFPDYLADLEVVLDFLQKDQPVNLVAHSLGGNVAALYAGIRPERVAKLVNLEGFGMPPTQPEQAPKRYRAWLDELKEKPGLRPYANFDELAERLRKNNARLTPERAAFLARHWGKEEGGRVVLRGDPAHKIINPLLYRYEEARAVWREVRAPVLWVEASDSDTLKRMKLDPAHLAERRAAFVNLRLELVRDAGHMLHHDQPEAVARLIEGFLA
jgi:pimeloyl-ACP methyl ester carboxylesterase